jgi:hypothetical protein
MDGSPCRLEVAFCGVSGDGDSRRGRLQWHADRASQVGHSMAIASVAPLPPLPWPRKPRGEAPPAWSKLLLRRHGRAGSMKRRREWLKKDTHASSSCQLRPRSAVQCRLGLDCEHVRSCGADRTTSAQAFSTDHGQVGLNIKLCFQK